MTRSPELRRGTPAQHCVETNPLASRLQTTVAPAARALRFPVAAVNILDLDTQHTVSVSGPGSTGDLPRTWTLCDHVIRSAGPITTNNAVNDDRFSELPCVRDGAITSYVGVPLIGRESLVVGVLCVTDSKERDISAHDVARLIEFARVVEDQLDLMRLLKEQRRDARVATADLADAIRLEQIVPWYQPVVDLVSGRVCGFEALARWQHPMGEVLQPNSFVPLAEDSDLIIDMDLSVMRRALPDLARWQRTDPDLQMSVDLSGRHFEHADWIHAVQAATDDAGVAPSSVNIEVTETAQLTEEHDLGVSVQALKQLGFNVWLDFFGTGWSSMEYLLQMPVDSIKLSRVVSGTLGSHIGNALIRAVTGLASELGLHTTIEGIESVRNAALARRLGCDQAQGYLWSKAVPASVVDATAIQDLVVPAMAISA